MRLYQLAYVAPIYAGFAGFDRALGELLAATRGAPDPYSVRHQKALFTWLRAWGCRQFDRNDERTAATSLRAWADEHLDKLPARRAQLIDLRERDLDDAADAYRGLEARRAGRRRKDGKVQDVTFGPTGASKVLFALRPMALPPWDNAIRERFSGSYRTFLDGVRRELREVIDDARRLGIDASEIPGRVGRPKSSLAKLADEYHWVTIARKVRPPTPNRLAKWTRWATPTV